MSRFIVVEVVDDDHHITDLLNGSGVVCEVEPINAVHPCDICGLEFEPAKSRRDQLDADTFRRKTR